MNKNLLLAILYFSPLLWRGAGGEVSAQQLSPFDSVIINLEKAKTSNGIDTAYIVKAFASMSTLKITDEQHSKLQKEALKFKGIANDDYYFAVKTFAWVTYLKPETYLFEIESGKQLLVELGDCKTEVQRCCFLSFFSILRIPFRNSDKIYEGFDFFSQKLTYYLQKNDSDAISDCYFIISGVYRTLGLKDQQIYNLQKSIEYINVDKVRSGRFPFIKNIIGKNTWANQTAVLGSSYLDIGDYKKAMVLSRAALQKAMDNNVPIVEKLTGFIYGNIGQAYLQLNKIDSAKYFLDKAFTIASKTKIQDDYAEALFEYGIYYNKLNKIDSAVNYFNQCIQFMQDNNLDANSTSGNITPRYYLSLLNFKQNKFNDAIQLIVEEMPLLKNLRQEKLRNLKLLAEIYSKAGDEKKSNETYQQFIIMQEQLNADEKKNRSISYDVEAKIAASEKEMKGLLLEKQFATKSRNYLIGIAALILLISIGILNRYLSKNKTNKQLSNTLAELKSTQQQLVQQEKLASLGALTAGIAHEIKNPLNFVNNFSELSQELISEFKESKSEEERNEILSDLEKNLEKINQHGKRADSIVQGMLQHSRSGNAEKQLTDINKLCDEFMSLAYHGMRANVPDFNCELVKSLDESLPKINVVQQDISRVILNLLNNAFYAVRKRGEGQVNGDDYKPQITLTTKQQNNKILISIRDNGSGIPESIKQKIFEPFFTTKPTGDGTGLGLSICNDVIKAHGGELKVESKEGEGSEFIITLTV